MPSLRDKFKGCIAASWIGSAMGAAVECWMPDRIQKEHGFVDRLLPYCHYGKRTPEPWESPAGTTEDGIERQRLLATAIIEKRGRRVLARDVVATWVRDLSIEHSIYKQEDYDRALIKMARSGVPAEAIGGMRAVVDNVGPARSAHPLGLVNACDPPGAADEVFEVCQMFFARTAPTIRWAALYCAAIAEACRDGATVDSVLRVAREYAGYRAEEGEMFSCYDRVAGEVDRALDIAKRHTEYEALRDEFYRHYFGGYHVIYGQSQANEVLAKGLALFAFTKGDPKQAILYAVNFGRDTDCLAAVAGGLAGALSGWESLPPEWLRQVDEATAADPHTNNKRTIDETVDGLYGALVARLEAKEAHAAEVRALVG